MLPAGLHFYPTEEELVSFYLHQKLEGKRIDLHRVIPVLNIFEHEPCRLPGDLPLPSKPTDLAYKPPVAQVL
ncbi:hypothetical protein C3L33_19447, partial [Rhododendron williamsianum]